MRIKHDQWKIVCRDAGPSFKIHVPKSKRSSRTKYNFALSIGPPHVKAFSFAYVVPLIGDGLRLLITKSGSLFPGAPHQPSPPCSEKGFMDIGLRIMESTVFRDGAGKPAAVRGETDLRRSGHTSLTASEPKGKSSRTPQDAWRENVCMDFRKPGPNTLGLPSSHVACLIPIFRAWSL